MSKRSAVFGGSFNPPGIHHRRITEIISGSFDEVVVVPCGPRPDKVTTNDIEPIYRAVMADMTFGNLTKVRVELFDLEQETFTRTHRLEEIFRAEGEVWHVIGTDLIRGGKDKNSFIHRVWERGTEIWEKLNFVIIMRPGFECDANDMPSHHKIFTSENLGVSTEIRERVFNHQPIDGLVTKEVAEYIERYGLYRGMLPNRSTKFSLEDLRLLVVTDDFNDRAKGLSRRFFEEFADTENPNLIGVIGGDGTMLRAIRKYWRLRVPFLGFNAGHRGFLLNNKEMLESEFPPKNLILRQTPLLYVETFKPSGGLKTSSLAFNDVWAERETGQTAWFEVKVDGRTRLKKLVSDGVLVSTAAGSTAYARAMGATPMLVDTPALLLVGSNVMEPPNWKSVHLSLDSTVEFVVLDPEKRPVRGFVDGVPQGEVTRMVVRVSNIAAVELAFYPEYDITEKLGHIQFPQQQE